MGYIFATLQSTCFEAVFAYLNKCYAPEVDPFN